MADLAKNITTLPDKPGIYSFHNKKGTILYVGKAKNIKKRVSSYFSKSTVSYKTKVLVKQIRSIKHIITTTESEALLLENSMIKKHQPKYNVLLKDDKTYPWICIKKERFPRIFLTRQLVKDGSEYIGPFTSVHIVKTLLRFLKEIYPIRTCNFLLSQQNILERKYKVCLEYHLGNCLGPCENKQTEENYLETINHVRQILKGKVSEVLTLLKSEMLSLSSQYKYEEAEKIKQKIHKLETYQSKSVVVNTNIDNVDVFSFVSNNNTYYVNYLKILKGAIVQAHNISVDTKLEESEQDILLLTIVELRERFESTAKEILVPMHTQIEIPGINLIKPIRGDKAKLLELSKNNARFFMGQQLKKETEFKKRKEEVGILNKLQEDLRLKNTPQYIECFDNSNIQGSNPVASCVVFKKGKAAKSEYRHYNIKTVKGIDDFASMQEIIFRRYKRILDEKAEFPDLIVIDGGKGQLNAAVISLKKLNLYSHIPIIGIAKRLEEIYYPEDKIPLYIDKNSPSLKLLQQIRNEAHRFGITFHRKKRSRGFINSELENITGIGEKTCQILLENYGSIEKIRKTHLNELINLVGKSKAEKIVIYFQSQSQKEIP